MKWQRARTDEQKEVRMREIISAAERLYEKREYEAINLAAIAQEAQFTRSNVYTYFTTKEEIFIELIKQDITSWVDDLVAAFEVNKEVSITEFASLWADLFIRHERLAGLIPILYTSLEKHATLENLINFKMGLKTVLQRMVTLLCDLFPSLSIDAAFQFIQLQTALAIGLYPMANISEKQLLAMKHTGLEQTQTDFRVQFQMSVEYILCGLIADNR